jgi:uncharacterized membrane protein (DUF2068 family)
MPRRISAILILAAGLAHLAIFFSLPATTATMLVFGLLYTLAGITQWRDLRLGSWMTILFVMVGAGLGIYAVLVGGKSPPAFGPQLLLIETVALLLSAMHLFQTSLRHPHWHSHG